MLTVEWTGPVLHVTLNRPEVRNALNEHLIRGLSDVFRNEANSARAVVLRGAGPGFCAGGDLDWMRRAASYSREENIADAKELAELFRLISVCDALTIAAIHGAAFGGACGLAASVDVTLATESAQFAFSEVKLGLIPATISPFVINRIGAGNAKWLFATGEVFTSRTALQIGLVHEVCPDEDLESAVTRKLKSVLSAAPSAVKLAKGLVKDAPISSETTAERLADARASEEGREGIAAFLEKRKASFVTSWPPKD